MNETFKKNIFFTTKNEFLDINHRNWSLSVEKKYIFAFEIPKKFQKSDFNKMYIFQTRNSKI